MKATGGSTGCGPVLVETHRAGGVNPASTPQKPLGLGIPPFHGREVANSVQGGVGEFKSHALMSVSK